MKYQEILDKIAALPSGAIITEDNRFDHKYVAGTLRTYRGNFIRDYFSTKNRTLNNEWYQDYFPVYNADDQDDPCCIKFRCPSVITLDDLSDGLRFVGGLDGIAYNRIKNQGNYSTYKKHRYTNPLKVREVSFIYNASSRMISVYGASPQMKNIQVQALFNDPTDPLITTFNKILDQYPIPEDAIPTIEQMIYLGQTRITSVTAPLPAGVAGIQPKPTKQKVQQ